jgi:hypothetical protein
MGFLLRDPVLLVNVLIVVSPPLNAAGIGAFLAATRLVASGSPKDPPAFQVFALADSIGFHPLEGFEYG